MDIQERLGIDIGGPFIASHNHNTDTSFFSDNYLLSKATEGVVEAVARLVAERFGPENTFIISKCGAKTEAKSCEWFVHNCVYQQTGLKPENLFFCRTREGKAPICAHLGITHFIDDRLDVHRHLTSVQNRILFQGHTLEIERFSEVYREVQHVHSWQEIVESLL